MALNIETKQFPPTKRATKYIYFSVHEERERERERDRDREREREKERKKERKKER